jgi:NAD(P)-dependent dehydrogenase (short-subunit alcohol dehydrogenase family)
MSTKLLEGEHALVAGCAGGIGRGIARALKEEGAIVLGSDIVAPPAEDGIDFLPRLDRRLGKADLRIQSKAFSTEGVHHDASHQLNRA